ncbi:sensor histidine kinase [Pedobacter deserti]|uniref:sensor histidine kinase n=1 Tax=Pedobacter deserti TaxID=2817382 RepID=UPI00210A5E38|nr:HAMP domain-containing sensor histidine kinase [Pedobacter sp. SYSU D00382]
MFNLFHYQTPSPYYDSFRKAYGYRNVRQIRNLCLFLICVAGSARIASFFYLEELSSMPNFHEYSLSNWVQICGSAIFAVICGQALKRSTWTPMKRDFFTSLYCLFLLSTTFSVSYIVSLHSVKNTLTVFLIGIVLTSVFFALSLRQSIFLTLYIVLLFIVASPPHDVQEAFMTVIAGIILASVFFVCSRYGYYFKSVHYIQLRQLREKNKEIQNLSHQKGEILAFVAHDLRAPINNIEALSSILINEQKEGGRTPAQMIFNSAVHAKNIINDLVEVAQKVKKPLELEQVDLVPFLTNLCTAWQTNTDGRNEIRLLTASKRVFAQINQSKFARVIDNLIGNGLKFSPLNSPIHVKLETSVDTCTICVQDFGIGIPEHLHDNLFDQFSKSGRTGLKGEKSIGLGLHISRSIIEQHGGKITVESRENEGSKFIISLNLAPAG